MIGRYTKSDDVKGLKQVFTTLVPFTFLWWVAVRSVGVSPWLAMVPVLAIILFTVRVFGLMMGVVSGMPQYVWSQHHNYHHAHNGNWDRYRGPYTTLSTDEYAALTRAQQQMYRNKCSVQAAPLAGFIYLIFNPRFTWLRGSIGLLAHTVRGKLARPGVSLGAHAASYQTRYWKSAREYRHMLWNNLV